MKHLISVNNIDKQLLKNIFHSADFYRKGRTRSSMLTGNIIVATLFYEPSTRTRLSFESAIHRLGMKNISTENAKTMSSAIKGETLEDTIEVVSGYADAIVLRHPDNYSAERAVITSSVPIINAGSGSGEHPTQAILDLYTISTVHELNGLKLAVVGDLLFGRTIHSLVKLASLFDDVTIYCLSDPRVALPEHDKEYAESKGAKIVPCSDWGDIPDDVDVIYLTRTQKERFPDSFNIREFHMNRGTLSTFDKKTIVLHPLPRTKELDTSVDFCEGAMYFKQAHYGVPVRMAILEYLLY